MNTYLLDGEAVPAEPTIPAEPQPNVPAEPTDSVQAEEVAV